MSKIRLLDENGAGPAEEPRRPEPVDLLSKEAQQERAKLLGDWSWQGVAVRYLDVMFSQSPKKLEL